MKTQTVLLLIFTSIQLASAADAPLQPGAPIEIPNSKGGFDYLQVDNAKRRLLLDHTGNGTLDIVNLDTEKLLKQIRTGAAQGVAIDEKKNRYFVSVSREKKLVVIDRTTLEKTGEVALDGPGDALAYDDHHNRVYVGHDDAKDLWVIDPDALKVDTTISIAMGPEYVIYDPAGERLFQNIKSDGTLLVIDAASKKITETWKTAPAKSPHGLVFDPASKRLFAAGTNGKLAILSAADGKELGSVDTVNGVDQIACDFEKKRIYCPSSSGSMTVVEITDKGGERLGDVKTAKGAKTVAVDPKTHAVWIAYAEGGKTFTRKFTAPN